MANELDGTLQRWTTKRRAALVLSLLKGETSAAEAARKHGLTVGQVEEWREVFLLGAENALRSRPRDDEGLKDEPIKRLKQKGGELGLELDTQHEATPRLRAQRRRSRAKAGNARWAMDLTHIDCGADGWGHLAVVIDCHDREVIGYDVRPARARPGGGTRAGAGLPGPPRHAAPGR